LLILSELALSAGYAALVLHTASWAEARALDDLFPYYGWHIRAFDAAEWRQARLSLGGLALVLTTAALALGGLSRRGRAEARATGAELGRVGRALWAAGWAALPRRQRQWLAGALAALTAARLYLSLTTPWADDGVSFEYFVRQPLLTVAAYYPLPNNHVLSNTLNWAFYQLHPTFWWSMRLPVLLTSTAATWGLFAGLRCRVGVGPAALAVGAFSWLRISLFHAAAGRGYWLVSLAAGVLFGCLLMLLDPVVEDGSDLTADSNNSAAAAADGAGPPRRAAWLGLVTASVLGMYAVPTAVYALASAFSWLGGQALWRRDWPLLGRAVAAGLVVVAATGLLYAPLLLVSGPAALVANPYVQTLAPGAFWRGLPAYVWLTEGLLLGQRGVGALGTLAGLLLLARLYWRATRGRLAPVLARRAYAVGLPALWFAGFPYALLAVQRVLPPERTLFYKAWFFMLAGALALADWLTTRPGGRAGGWVGGWQTVRLATRRRVLGLTVGLFAATQLMLVVRFNYQARRMTADRDAVFSWLAGRVPLAPALIPDLYTWALVRYSAHIELPGRPWPVDQHARPGVRYAYLVLRRGAARPPELRLDSVMFANQQFSIYRIL